MPSFYKLLTKMRTDKPGTTGHKNGLLHGQELIERRMNGHFKKMVPLRGRNGKTVHICSISLEQTHTVEPRI